MKMLANLNKVRKLILKFIEFLIEQFPISENSNADVLANLGSSINLEFKRTILIKILTHPSIYELEEACNTKTTEQTWIDQILNYIQNKHLPQ